MAWIRQQLATCILPPDIRLMIVDNGCAVRADVDGLNEKKVMLLRSETNLGFGGAVKLANKAIPDEDSICWMPGNGKVRLSDAIKWLRVALESKTRVSKGLRLRTDVAEVRKSRLVDALISAITGDSWVDIGGTPTLVTAETRVGFFESAPSGIEIEAHTIAFCNQTSVLASRPPITYGKRMYGSSSWRAGIKSELILLVAFIKTARAKVY